MSVRNDLRDLFARGVLGGANEHHCIDNGGCVICAGNRNADSLVSWVAARDLEIRRQSLIAARDAASKPYPGLGWEASVEKIDALIAACESISNPNSDKEIRT